MTEKEFYINCLTPIKINDSYVACGVCYNCNKNRSTFSLSQFRKLCTNTIELKKISKSHKNISYHKMWKRYVKIQDKIVKLQNKIKKLEGKI